MTEAPEFDMMITIRQISGMMERRALIPRGSGDISARMRLSPGMVSGDHVFLTGITGSAPDGAMPGDPETQFRQAFDKIGAVLAEAGSVMTPSSR